MSVGNRYLGAKAMLRADLTALGCHRDLLHQDRIKEVRGNTHEHSHLPRSSSGRRPSLTFSFSTDHLQLFRQHGDQELQNEQLQLLQSAR